MKPKPKIAISKLSYDASEPGLFDGWIVKALKHGIRLKVFGEDYILNRDGVFCYETISDGQKWYSYGGKLNTEVRYLHVRELADEIRKMVAI